MTGGAGTAPAGPEQLQMLWPPEGLASPPEVVLPAGYRLRAFQPGDRAGYLGLMRSAGFEEFGEEQLGASLKKVLPGGFFLALHRSRGDLAATAMATHNPLDLHPCGGELGWVAASPEHAGRKLGLAVSAAATARFLDAGYRRIYLRTDDWRLAAVKTYLNLGFVPFLFAPEMAGRWRAVCGKLAWPFTPESWPRGPEGGP